MNTPKIVFEDRFCSTARKTHTHSFFFFQIIYVYYQLYKIP